MAKTKSSLTQKKKCENCHRELAVKNNFYTTRNKLFPDGRLNICKKCINGKIDYDDINTVYNMLRQMDIPFIQSIWDGAGATIKKKGTRFGNYIQAIALAQYDGLTWNDSDILSTTQQNNKRQNKNKIDEEDKGTIYDKKWRGSYTESDLEYLNDYFKRLQTDFNIITVNHLDYAKKIAKASLAMDKAYDGMLKGESGASKAYKDLRDAFDNLCKSAQFSESTRGATSAGINGITEVVDKIETKEWIEEITVEEFPEDQLDHLLLQFSNIEKSL